MIVGMEVSITTLAGNLRSDWMRIVCWTGLSAAAACAGVEGAAAKYQFARRRMATSTLPTQKKYRATSTACTGLHIRKQCNNKTNTR